MAGVAVAAAACSGGGGNGPGPEGAASTTTEQAPSTTVLSDDMALARLAGGLEQMAIDLYEAGAAATAGDTKGAVPLALAAYMSTARGHHVDHLDEWNKSLQGGGLPTVSTADVGLKPTLGKMLTDAKDVAGIAGVIAIVEEILADTYLRSIPTLKSKDSIKIAGQILIVDQQHRAILNYLLGIYPVPEPFQVADKAAS